MRAVSAFSPPESSLGQAAWALAACAVVGVALVAAPDPIYAVGVGLTPFLVVYAADHAFLLCIGFVIFSFFRIHEAFPVLLPLRIPQLLAMPTLAALAWHLLGTRRIAPFWSRELTAFAAFFALTTLGVPFATDTATAVDYWTSTYVKIAAMTVAIAWLLRRPEDFAIAARVIVASGAAIAGVALYNKVNEIGLVEGTRVTIGRDISSVLGDPNDLSLVLLFPLSFALSLAARPSRALDRLLGGLGAVAISAAIVATQSRGGLLGMVAVFGVVASRFIRSRSALVALCVVGALAVFAMAGIAGRSSGGAAEEGIDESSMGRLYAWGAAWRMALSHPLHGVGLNNFVGNYFFFSEHWDGMNHAVHSTWMGVLAETGFPGLAAFVVTVALTTLAAWRATVRFESGSYPAVMRAISLSVLAGIVGFLASATFLTQGFTWPIYILLGLTVAVARYERETSRSEARA